MARQPGRLSYAGCPTPAVLPRWIYFRGRDLGWVMSGLGAVGCWLVGRLIGGRALGAPKELSE